MQGINKKKKEKMEWDPESKSWRPRWGTALSAQLLAARVTDCCAPGYKGMNNDPNKEWVMEAKDGEQFEEGADPFLAKSRAKKEAIQVQWRLPRPSAFLLFTDVSDAAEARQARGAQQAGVWQSGRPARDAGGDACGQANQERDGAGVCAAEHSELWSV